MTDAPKEAEWPKVSYTIWYLLPHRPGYIRADRVQELEARLITTAAHLAAAISLLEKGGKEAAPSNAMFDQMLEDYRGSLDAARAALKETNDDALARS